MNNTLIDLSNKPDLIPLATVVKALQTVASALGQKFFLMGAAARDLMLLHAHGIKTKRETKDVDFAVMVETWDAFTNLRQGLIEGGTFAAPLGPALHKLRHVPTNLPLDIVPFGGIERPDRTIAWPPAEDEIFDCFGAREALEASVEVLLPDGAKVFVASIPALVILKITAWNDRKLTHPGRDAFDLALYMTNYMECGNMERAATEHQDMYAVADYDHEATGARLLGRDVAGLLDQQATQRVLKILLPEADADGARLLVQQAGMELGHGCRLVGALCQGLEDRLEKAKP